MKINLKYLSVWLVIPFLFSCEGETGFDRFIKNSTDYDITMVLHKKNESIFTSDTVTILSGKTYALKSASMFRGMDTDINPISDIHAIEYIAPPGIFIDTDIMNPNNWQSNVFKMSKMHSAYTYNYTFTLKSENIWIITKGNVKN